MGEECHLAGKASRPNVCDVLTVASDLEVAIDDNDQFLNAGPLFDEYPACGHGDVGRDVDNFIELFCIESGEQRDVLR